ncbi:MAG: SdiA-regulated domain-containing protein [Pseudomonas sp.]|uniref:SdiA-regulated domain-containing protein n=2 Tax=Pseudomonadota TaxID=1224 RepID=UPI002719123E|nr:SdiA-regulated domain-containing protein [Pseudomonas sp.]MDO9618520.1 SdiA-regulated domain-containing protein [Pseudomonas sp.]MDZ4333058.1 SdiA-regulated domain-containing protein [Pseudomonas sp.]
MMSAAKGVLGRLPDISPWKWALLLLALTLVYQIGVQHLDNRLYFWIKTAWHETEWENRSLWLPEYQVRIDALPVAGVSNNLSGLTYDEGRDQLWAVLNNPEELLALSKDGALLARYPLSGFSDVEGITYLGDNLLLLAEERDQALVVVELPEQPGALFREDYRALTLGIDLGGNQGFEGVGYDRAGDRLYVVKEHSPRKLYEIRGLKSSFQGDFNLEVIDRQAWIDHKVFATDLSSVHYDEQTGHLALLSDESKVLIELDAEDGKLISFRSLLSGFAGLKDSVPQGEGITLDDQGNLYLVSEPNLFYRFEREGRPGA